MKIALTHLPFDSKKGHRPAKGYLKDFFLHKIIGKMDMLVSGHDHMTADVGTAQGTRLLISGAGGQFTDKPGFLVMLARKNNKGLFEIETLFREFSP